MGAGTIVYSFITDYELGAARVIPYRGHLTLDILNGIFLAASPWLFGFSDYVYVPHLIVGILEICVVAASQRHTSIETKKNRHGGYGANSSSSPSFR